MNLQVKQAGRKSRIWLATALFVALIAAFCVVSTQEKASAAAPTQNGINVPAPIPTIPPTLTSVPVPTRGTPHPTSTTPQPTDTPVGIPSPVPTGYPTVVPCYAFTDVQPSDWFYEPVNWMSCNGIAGGYSDGSFRPNNATTRGQTTKMLVGAFHLNTNVQDGPHFTDVPVDSPFYPYVETANAAGIIGGYACGSPGEPCDSDNRPYFRPNNLVTRTQITKIVVLTAQQVDPVAWQLIYPSTATFTDVPTNNTFFPYVETAVAKGVISGYECGGPGEPCPGRYFRTQLEATRAQISKITFLAALLP